MAEIKHPLKSAYVWMLIAIPLSAVIMGAVLLWLSISSFDGMVVDDYYQRGLQINEDLSRDKAALLAGIRGRLQADSTATRVILQSSDPNFQAPDDLQLRFSNATREGMDQVLALRLEDLNAYRGAGVTLTPGRWYIQVSSGDWRIGGSVLMTPDAGSIRAPLTASKAGP